MPDLSVSIAQARALMYQALEEMSDAEYESFLLVWARDAKHRNLNHARLAARLTTAVTPKTRS